MSLSERANYIDVDALQDEEVAQSERVIEAAAVAGVTALTATGVVSFLRGCLHEHPERNDGKPIIQLPHGNITLCFEVHSQGLHPSDIPDGVDGIWMEDVSNWYDTHCKRPGKKPASQKQLFDSPVDRNEGDFMAFLSDTKMPIYYMDAHVPYPGVHLLSLNTMETIQLGAGSYLLLSAAYDAISVFDRVQGARIRRRDMLKGLAGWYLTLPMISKLAAVLNTKENQCMPQLSSDCQALSDDLHPESVMVLKIRNMLMAYKQHQVMEQMGTKPHFVTNLGARHGGIESCFRCTQEEKLASLRRWRPLWKKFYGKDGFDKAVKLVHSGNGNHFDLDTLYIFPELTKIYRGE